MSPLVLLPALAQVASAAAGHAPEAINWWAWESHRPPMGWFMGDFLLFVALLAVAGVRPLRRILAERHTHIKRSIAEAALSHAEAVRAQKESRDRLAGVHGEAQAWLQRSRDDGGREREQLVAQAHARALEQEKDAQVMVLQEGRREQERLRAEIAAATIEAARQRLRTALDDVAHQRLIEAAIVGLETGAVTPTERRS